MTAATGAIILMVGHAVDLRVMVAMAADFVLQGCAFVPHGVAGNPAKTELPQQT